MNELTNNKTTNESSRIFSTTENNNVDEKNLFSTLDFKQEGERTKIGIIMIPVTWLVERDL